LISLSNERRRAVESLLNRLAGVHSARVETGPNGEVECIHVVSSARFTPAQQARNIESALLAALNLDMDPRLISIVPLKEDDAQVVEGTREVELQDPGERRVRLLRIAYEQDRFKVTAHVQLGWEGRMIYGTAEDTDTAKGRMMAAGRATLNALEQVTERRIAFFLEGLEAHQTFERTIVVASLRLVSEFKKANLVGCATVEEDPNYAAAQAVLGAVNRSFARLLVYAASPAEPGEAQPSPKDKGEAQERYAELS
jgi:hypothetical protein